MHAPSNKRVLGLFTLSMISVSAIIALRNLPTYATNGFSIVFFLTLAALLFFIPVALTCAELASAWPKNGGLYAWVKEAFGQNAGCMAVWLEWIESVVWLPMVLIFIASNIAYLIDPLLIEQPLFMCSAMLTILWSGTLLNFLSIDTSSKLSSFGIIVGSIIPGIAIIGLGGYWVLKGQPIQIDFSLSSLLPEKSFKSFSHLTAIALGFGGIEVAAFYVQDTKNPKITFPRATFIAALLIIGIYVLGALAIAVVVPKEQIHLSAGLMQAISQFFNFLNIPWAIPVFAAFGSLGGLALLNTWLIGPSKGLLVSAQNGDLPRWTRFTNRRGSPVMILFMQAFIGSLLVSVYWFIPTINQFYWIFGIQAGQLILMMYCMLFVSVIKLRYSQPDTPRPYQIPGGKMGVWIVAGCGILFSIAAFCLGFNPPVEYQFTDATTYSMLLLIGLVIFCSPPLIWQFFNRKVR